MGANSHGQLGHGTVTEACAVPVEFCIHNLDPATVETIVGGGGHTLLSDQSGRVYATGWNNRGQLGFGGADGLKFQLVQALEGHKIIQLACSWDSSLAVSQDGSLLVWGSNTFGQLGISKQKLPATHVPFLLPTSNVTQASFGLRHMAVVTKDGSIFVCGSGKKGQLGLTDVNGHPVFEVDALTKVPNIQNAWAVACGQHHTVALMNDGSILAWGDNRYGQLGLDSSVQVAHIPQPVSVLDLGLKGTPQKLFSGWTHTTVLTDKGEVINWGRNTYGQLGSKIRPVLWKPSIVPHIFHARMLAQGSEHTTAILDSGEVVSWGWNEHGNCGNGTQENVWDPTPVLICEGMQGKFIGSGACHTFAVMHKKDDARSRNVVSLPGKTYRYEWNTFEPRTAKRHKHFTYCSN